jgi:hypothetical protein
LLSFYTLDIKNLTFYTFNNPAKAETSRNWTTISYVLLGVILMYIILMASFIDSMRNVQTFKGIFSGLILILFRKRERNKHNSEQYSSQFANKVNAFWLNALHLKSCVFVGLHACFA